MTGARWCPNCRSEYVEGWGVCSTCGVPLVDSLPPERVRPEPVPMEPLGGEHGEDPLVSIWEGPTPEAERVRAVIESALIPVDLDDATNVGDARVLVPRSYLRDASDALRDNDGSWPEPIRDDDRERGFDWPPGVKLTLVLVALVLIVLMLLAS